MRFRSVVGIIFGLVIIALSSSFAPGALAQQKLWRIGWLALGSAADTESLARNPPIASFTTR